MDARYVLSWLLQLIWQKHVGYKVCSMSAVIYVYWNGCLPAAKAGSRCSRPKAKAKHLTSTYEGDKDEIGDSIFPSVIRTILVQYPIRS